MKKKNIFNPFMTKMVIRKPESGSGSFSFSVLQDSVHTPDVNGLITYFEETLFNDTHRIYLMEIVQPVSHQQNVCIYEKQF